MPSIPQSLLWISLVVLWLFVLVPMLISKREAVRRTSDVALATRVLNSGPSARKLRRGPAAGHRSDPEWQPAADENDDVDADDTETRPLVRAAETAAPEPDYLDVDVVEEEPVAAIEEAPGDEAPGEEAPEVAAEETPEPVASEPEPTENADEPDDGLDDEYEYVDDGSGLEAPEDEPPARAAAAQRHYPHESKVAAAVSARKYRFRRRTVSVLCLLVVGSAGAAATIWPGGWWFVGIVAAALLLYLAYLRRQTRIEEQLRRRRAARVARSRQTGVENTVDRTLDVTPSRLRRPGAIVLEIDDEDPIFEHLDAVEVPVEYPLPQAAGQ
ncbi:hypothetical protein LV457_01500 [Mycobacterium sp. MYCO198283]|uniref:divisome protein SepX/GlpR n=1 Tax=Mycobacterium sp. MYCO198283 TaxID=2883505 RepID=UPI001E343E23|nr:gephyrin-like molybdotransferase receptor GlpR [Mycobacterium sp. MYCO198283]MCG5430972.1 hypothetical protein [Mycobacterium sp. MYCO198283]